MGMAIYHFVEGLAWSDSFLNSSMLLGGMGPVNRLHTTAGKVARGRLCAVCRPRLHRARRRDAGAGDSRRAAHVPHGNEAQTAPRLNRLQVVQKTALVRSTEAPVSLQIRPDIRDQYQSLFGAKTVNGRTLVVEDLIVQLDARDQRRAAGSCWPSATRFRTRSSGARPGTDSCPPTPRSAIRTAIAPPWGRSARDCWTASSAGRRPTPGDSIQPFRRRPTCCGQGSRAPVPRSISAWR